MTGGEGAVEIDPTLREQLREAAARTGRTESEIVADALRRHLARQRPSVVDEVWARNATSPLDPNEALALAYGELDAVRVERRAGSAS